MKGITFFVDVDSCDFLGGTQHIVLSGDPSLNWDQETIQHQKGLIQITTVALQN